MALSLSWYERGIVAAIALWCLLCSRLFNKHALDVVEGFIVRVLRFLVEMLDGFRSCGKSVIALALASPQFTEEGKLRERFLAIVIRPVDGNVFRTALRSFHQSRFVLGLCLLLVEDFGLDDDGEAVGMAWRARSETCVTWAIGRQFIRVSF